MYISFYRWKTVQLNPFSMLDGPLVSLFTAQSLTLKIEYKCRSDVG